jgi:hypothetical protein
MATAAQSKRARSGDVGVRAPDAGRPAGRVSEGLFYAAITAWGYFYEHGAPVDAQRRWARLERLTFFVCSTLSALARVRDPCAIMDLLGRCARAAAECERLLEGLDLDEAPRRHIRHLRNQLSEVRSGP